MPPRPQPNCSSFGLRTLVLSAGIMLVASQLAAAPTAFTQPVDAPAYPWQATLETEGQFRAEASNFATRLALPIVHQRSSATVLQVEAAKGEEDFGGFTAGVIQRFRPYGGDWVFGFYGFYEARQTAAGFGYHQLAFGGQVSRGRHLLRATGWVPISEGETFRHHDGDRFETSPTSGFDIEYQVELPSPGLQLQPRLAVGYYYLAASDLFSSHESGLKLRAELQYRWLTAGLEWREDARALGGNWLGTVRVSVPLGRTTTADEGDRRLTEPVRRDDYPSTFTRVERATRVHPPATRRAAWAPTPVQPVTETDCCGGAPAVLIYD